MQSLRDGPLQSRLCVLRRVRQQLAASEPRRFKKMDTGNCRARQARALDVISFFKLSNQQHEVRGGYKSRWNARGERQH
jgi:hypothetical protein